MAIERILIMLRLINKNTINLHGKPLFMWTVEQALKSKYLDRVVISTDDNKIIKFSKKIKNIKVTRRTKKLGKLQPVCRTFGT